MGIFIKRTRASNKTEAIKTRTDKNMNGSAYGNPYLAPTKPVLQRRTNRNGANFWSFNLRKSP